MQQKGVTYLSDLLPQQSAIITGVGGEGAFRRRIAEMGFVCGTCVTVIKKAPLPFRDPVEYEVMGYRLSLRKSEARMIEVKIVDNTVTNNETLEQSEKLTVANTDDNNAVKPQNHHQHHSHTPLRVALVGNPNSGKTTLFNHATGKTERTGNYGGVTVDIKTAHFTRSNRRIDLTDLPGTYSMSEYSPEELFVRQHLTENPPDVVINVVDASNLERNLYLTTQLMDLNLKVVIALNMYDELQARGDTLDYRQLGKLLGMPVVPTVAAKGRGIDLLIDTVIEVAQGKNPLARPVHIRYGNCENCKISSCKNNIYMPCAAESTEEQTTAVRYAFIRGALKETLTKTETETEKGYELDKIFTHKYFGIPVFLMLMWAMFQITFSLGAYPTQWIEQGVTALSGFVNRLMDDGLLRDMLTEGVIAGVGGVIVFLPNIIILFLCISLMEDTGYMARAAFIMDRLMHKIGLHGKSFIPMLMGFGCNVPAIMATRTLENRKDRLITMLIIPFMSCSARLPVYILFISVFFVTQQALVMLSIYLIGVAVAAVAAILFNKIVFKKHDMPFVMELPPYRLPAPRNIASHTWAKSVQYLQKMGTIILFASLLVWALGYFPHNEHLAKENPQLALQQSYIGRIGKFIEPAIAPLGYDWKIGVSLLTGMGAKEIVVSSMGVLYHAQGEADENSESLKAQLKAQRFTSGKHAGETVFTPRTTYSFLIFILLYFPCIAALAAIRREAGTKWALFAACYTTAMAWLLAFAITNLF